jgi:hypothetical protein
VVAEPQVIRARLRVIRIAVIGLLLAIGIWIAVTQSLRKTEGKGYGYHVRGPVEYHVTIGVSSGGRGGSLSWSAVDDLRINGVPQNCISAEQLAPASQYVPELYERVAPMRDSAGNLCIGRRWDWAGFTASVLHVLLPEALVIAIVTLFVLLATQSSVWVRLGATQCRECGYDLRGSPDSSQCPECGKPVA